jgi:hypothetical protein
MSSTSVLKDTVGTEKLSLMPNVCSLLGTKEGVRADISGFEYGWNVFGINFVFLALENTVLINLVSYKAILTEAQF